MAQNSILRDKYLDTQHVYAGSGADTSPSYTFSSALSTGIYINTEGSVATSIGGTGRFIIGSTQVSTNAVVLISNTTASTSATTGALVVSGSVGVAGSLNLGSSLNVIGSSTLNSLSVTSAIYTNNVNINNNSILSGRLTLTSNVPVTTSDVLAATTVFFTPYKGNYLTLYTNSIWQLYMFTQLSIAVPATTATNYDVFIYDNTGTLTLALSAWTNGTTRAVALSSQDSVLVRSNNLNYRYLGSFRTTGVSGRTEDSALNRLLYNYYNRITRSLRMMCSGNWTYTSTTIRLANNSTTNSLLIMIGVLEEITNLLLLTNAYGGGGHQYATGFGINQTVSFGGAGTISLVQSAGINTATASFSNIILAIGINTVSYLERGSGTLSNVFGSTAAGGGALQSGLIGSTMC